MSTVYLNPNSTCCIDNSERVVSLIIDQPTNMMIDKIKSYRFSNLKRIKVTNTKSLYGVLNNKINYILQTAASIIPKDADFDKIHMILEYSKLPYYDPIDDLISINLNGESILQITTGIDDLQFIVPDPLRFETLSIKLEKIIPANLFLKNNFFKDLVLNYIDDIPNIKKLCFNMIILSEGEPDLFDKLFGTIESVKGTKLKSIYFYINIKNDKVFFNKTRNGYTVSKNTKYEIQKDYMDKNYLPHIEITFS